jgi:hypothetical protein
LHGSPDFIILQNILNQLPLSNLFNSLQSLFEINFWSSELSTMGTHHQLYHLLFLFDAFNWQVLGTKAKHHQSPTPAQHGLSAYEDGLSFSTSQWFAIMFWEFGLSGVGRGKLQKNIQKIEEEIVGSEALHRHVLSHLAKLKARIYELFCDQVERTLAKLHL